MINPMRFSGILTIIAFALAYPVFSHAAIDGSPHDLVSQGYILPGDADVASKCIFCHLPAGGSEQFPQESLSPSIRYYSRSGMACYSCHDGTSIVSRDVDASQSSFHPDSHTLSIGYMPQLEDQAGHQGLPVREKKLECITCHSNHDNSIRPFLRGKGDELCVICHTGRDNVGYGINNITGSHPINETLDDDAGKKSPISPGKQFTVPFPQAYPVSDGRYAPDVHWRRGGHLSGEREETLGCMTCHTVHGSEEKAPIDGLLAIDPVRNRADEFCEGCHQGQRGDGQSTPNSPNPGGTTTARTYHPCDDDIGNGIGKIVPVRSGVEWPFGKGAPQKIICTTCHTPHGGMQGTPALRQPVNSSTFCEECHLAELMPNHHPSGTGSGDKRKCEVPNNEYWLGEEVEGEIYCSSCHVAHNAGLEQDESQFIPILKIRYSEDDLCLACHPEDNISCLESDRGTASHFLGDPTLPDTYDDSTPPLRVDEWPETKAISKYGGGNNEEVICLSCHVFSSKASGPLSGKLPNYLLARAGDNYEWEDDPGTYLCTGCHGLNPGTGGEGHSHPLMEADLEALSQQPISPATYTLNGHLNCDSCHRAHGALKEGGYYILEAVRSANEDPGTIHPDIDFSVLCHLCHSSDEY